MSVYFVVLVLELLIDRCLYLYLPVYNATSPVSDSLRSILVACLHLPNRYYSFPDCYPNYQLYSVEQ